MKRGFKFFGGLALGAGCMFLLDPERGRTRRARLRDGVVHTNRVTHQAMRHVFHDLSNRAHGLFAETWTALDTATLSDATLVERVRSRMGHVVEHAHALHVTAEGGVVTVSGPIQPAAAVLLLECVASVPGVTRVCNHLCECPPSKAAESLGVARLRRWRSYPEPQAPTPISPLLTGAMGGMLVYQGARRRGLFGAALNLGGLGLLSHSLKALESDLLMWGTDLNQPLELEETIEIAAPVEQVFEFWTNFDNLPRCLCDVKRVEFDGRSRCRWVLKALHGKEACWDSVITTYVPMETLAWIHVPGSPVRVDLTVHFHATSYGTTCLQVQMVRHPYRRGADRSGLTPFGLNPEYGMEQALLRQKALIEE